MNKFNKAILNSLVLIPTLSISFTSCSNTKTEDPELPPQEYIDFIYDRTFSILGSAEVIDQPGTLATVLGTCWIIDDTTPSIPNDYIYYAATNWHVTHGNDYLKDSTTLFKNFKYKYADYSLTSKPEEIIDINKYMSFSMCERQGDNNFLYTTPLPTDWFIPCIDMHVYKVDFGTPRGQIKNKLDKLNVLKQETGRINDFVNGDDNDVMNCTKYVGGYPVKRSRGNVYGGKWEVHELKPDTLIYREKGQTRWESYEGPGHAIGTPDKTQKGKDITYGPGTRSEPFYEYDVSPQYKSTENKGGDWMTGGASGSMLITDDFKICGIYWGGSGSLDGSSFWPHFSLFKTTEKDFINQWLTKKIRNTLQ